MDRQTLISELVGEAYPVAVSVDGRLRRNWVARTVNAVPDEHALTILQTKLEEDANLRITTAYASSTSPVALAHSRPSIALFRIDDRHLVVTIEFAGPDKSVGDAAMIAQWGVLQALDDQLRVEDLQGLPADCWFPLRAGSETR